MNELIQRFTSRKFLVALVGAVVVFGNYYYNWGISEEQVWQILTPIVAFIGVEGVRDVKRS